VKDTVSYTSNICSLVYLLNYNQKSVSQTVPIIFLTVCKYVNIVHHTVLYTDLILMIIDVAFGLRA